MVRREGGKRETFHASEKISNDFNSCHCETSH